MTTAGADHAATAASDAAPSRVRLRRDVVYLKVEGGILFRTRRGAFALKGARIYETFASLVPLLSGTHSVDDLLALTRLETRQRLADFMAALINHDVVLIDSGGASEISPRIAELFAPQIDFIDHFGGSGALRFQSFREKHVLLVGDGAIFESAGVALLRNGLKSLHLRCPDATWTASIVEMQQQLSKKGVECNITLDGPESGDADISLYCAERPNFAAMLKLNKSALQRRRYFLPAVFVGSEGIVGPFVGPDQTGCWLCAMLRWEQSADRAAAVQFWHSLSLDEVSKFQRSGGEEIAARVLGNTVALELFKFVIGGPDAETNHTILIQDLSTFERTAHRAIVHNDCPHCTRATISSVARGSTSNITVSECLDVWASFLDKRFGIFTGFEDGGLRQIPMCVSVLHLGDREDERHRRVAGWSTNDRDEARANAVRNAITMRARHAFPSHLQRRLIRNPEAKGVEVLHPSQIVGCIATYPKDVRCASYLVATDTVDRSSILVPAGAFHFRLDDEGYFRSDTAGVGVGLSEVDAMRESILSLYEGILISEMNRGEVVFRPVRPKVLEGDVSIKHLLRFAETVGAEYSGLAVVRSSTDITAATVLSDSTAGCAVADLPLAFGWSEREAVTKLLAKLIAAAQMDSRLPLLPGCSRTDRTHVFPSSVDAVAELKPTRPSEAFAEQLMRSADSHTVVCVTSGEPELEVTGTFMLSRSILVKRTSATNSSTDRVRTTSNSHNCLFFSGREAVT